MRSFFKKPAWATTDDEPSAPEFYRRSQQTYNDIVKARRQQHGEKTAKSALKSSTESEPPTNPRSKRRRLSEPDDNEPREQETTTDSGLELAPSLNGKQEESVVSGVASQHSDSDALEGGLTAVDAQELISPDLQVVEAWQAPKKKNSLSHVLPTDELTQAQENSYNSRVDSKMSSANNITGQLETADQDTPTDRAQIARNDHKIEKKADNNQEEDATVEILITSAIEGTRPLVVHRRMSQRFRDVRLAWCERQGFDKRMTSSVYLTWNKRRLFDVTTCRSLDCSSLASQSDDLELDDGVFSAKSPLRIHVEAVTDELLRFQAEQSTRSTATVEYEFEEKRNSFHIVLKSQDRGDLRLKVMPETTVSQIITNFRNKRKISSASTVSLSFDGDVLDPTSQLKDYDIADLDLVDVLLR